jgi:DNA-binding NarL/FixJ family response regulator
MPDGAEAEELSVAVTSSEAPLLRPAVERLRAEGLNVCAASTDPQVLRAKLRGLQIDAVVCLVPDPAQQLRRVAAVRQGRLDAHIVLVGPRSRGRVLRRLLDAGVDPFVVDTTVRRLLGLAVRGACAGQVSVPVELSRGLERPPLTFGQKQVLRLAVLGKPNAESASELYLSQSTVKDHLWAVFSERGVRSRHEAAALVQDKETGQGLGVMDAVANGNGHGAAGSGA